ncbi:MAG TPA: hypothetical protein VMI11_08130 [Actinomycetes bacterium]|nr:hypothetical protein [Actinomycetes bacterium]
MSLTQWVRRTSEHYLMVEAMDTIGEKLGANRPPAPRGVERFWREVYVPVFHRLPVKLRAAMIARMPGSHRKSWPPPPRPKGPVF